MRSSIGTQLPPPSAEDLNRAIRIHNELSLLVAPATAASIRASNILGNWALAIIFFFAVFFFGLLIGATFIPNDALKVLLQVIGAAGLGSSFSQLYGATEYITSRTFDPKYNQVYLIRFALGIIAGKAHPVVPG